MSWEVRTMQSKTSYFNATLFRKNLTRFWPLWGLASFVGALFPLAVLLDMEGLGVQQADVLNEEAVRVACALCSRLLEAGVRLSVASNGVDVHSGRPLDLPEVSGAGSVLSLRKSFACLQAGNGLAPIQSFFPEGDSSLLCVLVSRSLREDLAREFAQRAGQREWVHITPCLEVPEEQPRLGAVHRFYWEV